MAKRFVEIDSKLLEDFLSGCGFRRIVQGSEIVYVINHKKHESVRVKVYTSIKVGENLARPCGADAIRVVAAYEGQRPVARPGSRSSTNFGIFKAKKILRTGSQEAVTARLHERMREAYAFGTDWLYRHWREVSGS
jgi:hypothetical protein